MGDKSKPQSDESAKPSPCTTGNFPEPETLAAGHLRSTCDPFPMCCYYQSGSASNRVWAAGEIVALVPIGQHVHAVVATECGRLRQVELQHIRLGENKPEDAA